MKRCLIITGGDFDGPEIRYPEAQLVIACDRGYEYCCRLGLTPDIIIGDFDSAEKPKTDIPMLTFPPEKNDTDTMLAVRYALEQQCTEIVIGCCMGGRFDHLFANLQSAVFALEHHAGAAIVSADTRITFLKEGKAVIPMRKGWSLSCFSYSDCCEHVSISGTSYEVEDITITNGFPIGISNNWNAQEAIFQIGSGILMIVESKLKEGEHIDEGNAWDNLARRSRKGDR